MGNRILSCVQATGGLTLGNYLGALKNWAKMQDEDGSECLYGVVDLHAITVPYDHEKIADYTREAAAAFIASGIDPARSVLFVQSAVRAHTELNWMLGSMTQMGKLNRMTQFKDKAGKNAERAGLGLYAYPVLMAADILIYQATHVPVGEDQMQHIELTRDVAATFNHRYEQDFFTMPEGVLPKVGARVMSFRDGTQKMSKSAESDMSRINMTDDADTIAKKIKKSKSDADLLPETVEGLEGRPEAKNLVGIYAALADLSQEEVVAEYAGKGFGVFKPALADLAVEKMAPITSRMNALMDDKAEIDRILAEGSQKASAFADQTVEKVKEIMGFWRAS